MSGSKPSIQLGQYGEDRLIATLTKGFVAGKKVLVGIGDDCAVLGKHADRVWRLSKTDALIENIHFHTATEPQRVGWKAIARAVSDIAAMGGTPLHAMVTMAAPTGMSLAYAKGIYAGIRKCCKRFDISLVGGETSRSPGPLFLNVALLGEVERNRCVLRSGAQPADRIYVTGLLGGAIAGKHLDFMPRLEEARWLTKHFPIHAMMDLSDGLGADLPRMARASNLGFSLGELPCNKGCTHEAALSNGEDYELLFAIAATDAERLERMWHAKFKKLQLTCIGEFTKSKATLSTMGHDHFA